MEDKDLKSFFQELKAKDSQRAPDFEELLKRPRPELSSKNKGIRPLFRYLAAASVLLLFGLSVFYWILPQNSPKNEALALDWVEDSSQENVLNWEPKTDELLPTENTQVHQENKHIKAPNPPKKIVLDEEIKALLQEVPELKAEWYEYGSISNWESPTNSLMWGI